MIVLTTAATAFFIFALGISLIGVQYSFVDNLFNFIGMVMIFIVIFLLGRYAFSMFDSFRRTGQTFDKILDTSPNIIIIVNDKARVEYISKSFVEILGIEKREYAANLPFVDLFPSVKYKNFFGKLLGREDTFIETFDVDVFGKQRWFILRSAKIGTGKIARLFECVDITLMVESQRAAEAAARSKGDFLAAVSHEIRTPMNAIIGIAQIHLQKGNLPAEYAEALEKIYASGNSMLGIINDILDVSKIETGRMTLTPAEYDVPNLINDSVRLNIVRIGTKPVKFALDIDEKMPSKLFGDELRLKQILNNLLSNAIKYTWKGLIKLSVSHFVDGKDIMLRFVVEDTGQGMKSEDVARLFSEYLRFNSYENRAVEGTGLGLNITKKLVEMMGGTIGVQSEFGKGSIFTVTVRQKAVEGPTIGAELAQKLRDFTFTDGKQTSKLQIVHEPMPYGSVLVVDDVETNLYVAEGLLSPYELKIELADSGFAALDKAQAVVSAGNTYDIIFMDHMMPKMDGIETTKKLRESGYKGVIVALTANALVGNDEMFSQHGFDGFISKPIDVHNLNEILNRFIRDRHPDEAKNFKPKTAEQTAAMSDETKTKLFRVFRRDAEKAVVTLRETAPRRGGVGGDIKLFTTTVHAMKSALANVGENEKSQLAAALEKAALDDNKEFIALHTEAFVKTLEKLIKELSSSDSAAAGADVNVTEDTAYLKELLQIVKTSCENYDDSAAYAALDRLKEKPWKPQTLAALEKIRDMIFLHSDFDGAAEQTGAFLKNGMA
jgi:signal transduction histidine kinase/DNA-binding response OmpR family regulator